MKPAPYYVLAIALAMGAVLIGVEIPSWVSLLTPAVALQSDFRVFYTPGYMLRSGQRKSIYDFPAIRRNQNERVAADNASVPFLHPAYEAVIFVPLSFLKYRTAYIVWAFVNFCMLGLSVFLLRPCLPALSGIGPQWILLALTLGFMPVAFAILAGQDSLLLLLILILVFRRIGSNELQGGFLLSLGVFRFQVLLPIVALFLLWRSFKFFAGWIIGSGVLLSLSAAITGIAAQIQYLHLLRAMGSVSFWLLLRRMANLRALLAAYGFGLVPLLLVSAFIFILGAIIGAKQESRQRLPLAISVSAMVTYYLFLHDLSVMTLSLLLAIDGAIDRRAWLRAALPAAVLAGFSVFWFARDHFYLGALLTSIFFVSKVGDLPPRSRLNPVYSARVKIPSEPNQAAPEINAGGGRDLGPNN